MSLKQWLFGKPTSPEELAEIKIQGQKMKADMEQASVQRQADHILNMQRSCFDFAKKMIHQQLWFINKQLQSPPETTLPPKTGRKEIDELFQERSWNSHYILIESYFSSMKDDILMQHTEEQYKSPELLQAIEGYREETLQEFFQGVDDEEFLKNFIGSDEEFSDITYWERFSIMSDRRKEQKVRKDLEREEKKQVENDNKIAQGKQEIDEAFESKKKQIENEENSYNIYTIKPSYFWLDASEQLKAYAQEKSDELVRIYKLVFIKKYKAEIDASFEEKKIEIQNQQWGFVSPRLPFIGGIDSLIKGGIVQYQELKEQELKSLMEE